MYEVRTSRLPVYVCDVVAWRRFDKGSDTVAITAAPEIVCASAESKSSLNSFFSDAVRHSENQTKHEQI